MQRPTPIRFCLAFLVLAGAGRCIHAATQIGATLPPRRSTAVPATVPTSLVTPSTSFTSQAAAAPQTPAQRPARHAEVTYSQGQLAVKADNSSLNQILREIGRQTGIKITGGVTDERVFGNYGPAPTSDVLAALLDGTASNLLLLQSDASTPGELILTPRQGGPTPPNPNAPGFDDEGSSDDAQQPPPPVRNTVTPEGVPAAAIGFGGNNQASPSTTPAATTDPNDPNAVKTPQQIYEQLQRLRQQQQQTPHP